MLSANEFNKLLVDELRQLSPFSLYWSDELRSCVPEHLELRQHPSDGLTHHQATITVDLGPCRTDDEVLSSTSAIAKIHFTTATPPFRFDRAVSGNSALPGRQVSAVYLVTEVLSNEKQKLAVFRKPLWSTEPARVDGIVDYLRRLL